MGKKELNRQLDDALSSEKEYKEMLQKAREEIIELKDLLRDGEFRGRMVKDFLFSLKFQTATLNRTFGVGEVTHGKSPVE